MPKRLSVKEVKDRLFKIHGDIVSLDESTYVNTSTPALFMDRDYIKYEWWATPNNILTYHHSHPKRRLEKTKHTNIKKYGVENPFQNEEIKQKSRQTCFKNHGVEFCMQNKEIYNKARQTCTEIYGYENPLSNEDVQKKFKQTCLKNHGVENPAQKREFSLKGARALSTIVDASHWKTGNLVACQASWEVKTVEYFNANAIDFQWQITFNIPQDIPIIGGLTYAVDGYLPDENKYIEIKGWFRSIKSKLKWEWFHATYPNSELWDKPKLKSLGIL